jgi:hypothetical protein
MKYKLRMVFYLLELAIAILSGEVLIDNMTRTISPDKGVNFQLIVRFADANKYKILDEWYKIYDK